MARLLFFYLSVESFYSHVAQSLLSSKPLHLKVHNASTTGSTPSSTRLPRIDAYPQARRAVRAVSSDLTNANAHAHAPALSIASPMLLLKTARGYIGMTPSPFKRRISRMNGMKLNDFHFWRYFCTHANVRRKKQDTVRVFTFMLAAKHTNQERKWETPKLQPALLNHRSYFCKLEVPFTLKSLT